MTYKFIPKGICATEIGFDITDGKVKNVKFEGGCSGNGKGISALVEGMAVGEVIEKLQGITCEKRGTSCPSELTRALKESIGA
jgi:uncharacterized protein (TIGR03905 family)